MFESLPVLRSVSQLRSRVRSWRAFGESVAVAPMSGELHEGHLSVVREARRRADRVLAALFIDPVDLDENSKPGDYTETEAQDIEMLEAEGCDAIYAPALSVLMPRDYSTDIHLDDLTEALCGKDDPSRFDGYILAMARLLNQVQADMLVFGERDWQKLAILRMLATDLALATEVIGVEIERDMDGVPYSSAAANADPAARAAAARLFRDLPGAAREITGGAPPDKTIARLEAAASGMGAKVAYLELLDAETLGPPEKGREARLFAAIRAEAGCLADSCAVRLPG